MCETHFVLCGKNIIYENQFPPPVFFSTNLYCPGIGPKLRQELVDVDVAAGLPVDALGHDPVAVDELDALVHDHGDVLVGNLLVPQHIAVVECDGFYAVLPSRTFSFSS